MLPTFKQFLRELAEDESRRNTTNNPNFGSSEDDTDGVQPDQYHSFGGTLTNNEKRVLALLLTDQLKASPGLARDIIAGDQNLVQALRTLKKNFQAVDVTPDGASINTTGIDLATNQGVYDPNTNKLTPLGVKLVKTDSSGAINPKTADLIQDTGSTDIFQ